MPAVAARPKRRPPLAAALACGLFALALAGCGSVEARRDRAIERGLAHLEAGNLEKARVEFQNALQVAPDDAEVRFRNAQVLERLGQTRAAAQFYQGTLDLDPAHARARASLARIYLFAGMPAEALALVETGLKRSPDDASLLAIRAGARAVQQNATGALADAERAVRLEPRNENAIAVLAGLYTADGRRERALALLEGGVAAHPASVDLRLALAQLHAAAGQPAAAERELREIVRLAPADRAHRVRLAQFLARASRPDDAEAVLRAAVAALPDDEELAGALVDFLAATRGPAAARQELDRQVASDPADHRARFALAAFLQRSGEPDEAEKVLKAVIDAEGDAATGLAARTRLAALRVARGDGAGAEQLLAAVLSRNPRDTDALILRGMQLLRSGDAKAAIADLRAVLRDQPNATGVLRLLAQAHVVNREPALAEESLRRALESDPGDADAALELGRLLVQLGRAEQGKPLLERVARQRPDDAMARDALFRAALGTKDFVRAGAAAAAALARDAKSPAGPLYLGLLAEAQGRPAEAATRYGAAMELEPRNAEAVQGLVRTLVASGRRADARRRLEVLAAQLPDYALPHALQGDLYLGERRPAEADRAFAAAGTRAPTWWVPVRGRSYAARMRDDLPGALAILEAALPKVDDALVIRTELAQLYEEAGRYDDAIRQYEDVLRASPDVLVAANNLAMLLVTHRAGDAASLERANQLVGPLAESAVPHFLDTHGWVKFRIGDTNAALASLEKAVRAAPDLAIARYHLAMAQLAATQTDRARENLRAAIAFEEAFPGKEQARLALERLERAAPPRS